MRKNSKQADPLMSDSESDPSRSMVKVFLFCFWLLVGLAVVACAMLVPSHLRSIDEHVVTQIGLGSPGVVEAGLELLPAKVSSARLLHKTAEELNLTRTMRFTAGIQAAEATGSAWQNPPFNTRQFQNLMSGPADHEYLSKTALLEVLRTGATRTKFQEAIITPDGRRILQNLSLTNTALFAPAGTAG